jgi:hypothetical protein
MKIFGAISVALAAVRRDSKYNDPLLNFLDRTDIEEYQLGENLFDSYDGAAVVAPAQFVTNEFENYEGEGQWELQGYKYFTVPYVQMPNGQLMTWEEYEPLMDEYPFVPDEKFQAYQDLLFGHSLRSDVQEYQDEFDNGRVPQTQRFFKKIGGFFSKVGTSLKKAGNTMRQGFQKAGTAIKKGFNKALPTLKKIGSAIGKVAEVALPSTLKVI